MAHARASPAGAAFALPGFVALAALAGASFAVGAGVTMPPSFATVSRSICAASSSLSASSSRPPLLFVFVVTSVSFRCWG